MLIDSIHHHHLQQEPSITANTSNNNTTSFCHDGAPANLPLLLRQGRGLPATTEENVSQYLGVSWDGCEGAWRAYVWIMGKSCFLGSFATEHEAARAVAVADWRRQHSDPRKQRPLGYETCAAAAYDEQQERPLKRRMVEGPNHHQHGSHSLHHCYSTASLPLGSSGHGNSGPTLCHHF